MPLSVFKGRILLGRTPTWHRKPGPIEQPAGASVSAGASTAPPRHHLHDVSDHPLLTPLPWVLSLTRLQHLLSLLLISSTCSVCQILFLLWAKSLINMYRIP